MQRLATSILAVAIGLSAVPAAAVACDYVYPIAEAEREAGARMTIEQSAAIIDAEVVRAPQQGRPALVRAVRTFKGPGIELFEIAAPRTSCDVGIGGVGSRQRLFLSGGPDLWYAFDTGTDPRHEDRLLGSDREQDWPFVRVPPAP